MNVSRSQAGFAATLAAVALAVATPATAAPAEPERRLDELNETIQDHAEGLLDAHADVVAKAVEKLEQADAELQAATEAADAATAEAAVARDVAQGVRRALETTHRAERRTSQKLAELTARVAAARDQLGAVARAAYQSGGLVGWSTLFEPDPPAGYAEQFQGTHGILRAGDRMVQELAAERAELAATRDRLRDVRAENRRLVQRAAEARAAVDAAEAAAETAQQDLEATQSAHADATAAAEAAKDDEERKYQEFLAESEALEAWLAEYSITEELDGTGTFVRPGTGRATSPFGPRMHPILGYVKTHTGADLGAGDGFIYAADHGIVTEATWNDAYGYLVIVDHGMINGQPVSTLYAHQPGLSVEVGDKVAKGQPIGSVGSTGFSTGPHLHFEVRIAGKPVNPWRWISDAPLPDDVDATSP